MKTIGILLREYKSQSNIPLLGFRDDLLAFLRKYEVCTIAIPVMVNNNDLNELKRVEECIKLCNGVILPGGAFNHEIDIAIIKYLYANNIPTLGICLGMQEMAMAFSGFLNYLPNNRHQSSEDYVHDIDIQRNSKLSTIIKSSHITVNSRHSEYIFKTDLNVSAISDDLIIEAVEDSSKRFFIGVQWHPESLDNDIYSQKLFKAFIDSL